MRRSERSREEGRWKGGSYVLLLVGTLLWLGGGVPLAGQGAPPPSHTRAGWSAEELEVIGVVQRLFDGMRARDGAVVASVFHSAARLQTAFLTASGEAAVRGEGTEGFIQAVGGGGEPWDERIIEAEVRVDGTMAHAWVPYTFHRGETFSHCGVNSIQLAREGGEWKVVSLVDTRRTEGCPI